MTDYILEIKNSKGISKFYHDIVSIDFYEKAIRVKDSDGVIIHFDIRDRSPIMIHTVQVSSDEERSEEES